MPIEASNKIWPNAIIIGLLKSAKKADSIKAVVQQLELDGKKMKEINRVVTKNTFIFKFWNLENVFYINKVI